MNTGPRDDQDRTGRSDGSGWIRTAVLFSVRDRAGCNPAATTTRISNSTIYSPNHGDFANKHLEGWAINHGNIVGVDNSTNIPGAPPFYVDNNPTLNGTVLTTAVTLWVYFQGTYHAGDGAKTHDATCEPQIIGNACQY